MDADAKYIDEDGDEFTAELIPARVVIKRCTKNHKDIEGNVVKDDDGKSDNIHVVGSVTADTLALERDKQFGKEIVDAGAQRWAREISKKLLGIQ